MSIIGKSVTASSVQPTYPANDVVDGDILTLWHSHWTDLNGYIPGFEWVQVDMEKNYMIAKVEVRPSLHCCPERLAH